LTTRKLSYFTCSAGSFFPCVISVMSVFCVHLIVYQQQQLGLPEARRLSSPSAGQAVQYFTVQIITPPPLFSSYRQGRTPCWVDSLQSLASLLNTAPPPPPEEACTLYRESREGWPLLVGLVVPEQEIFLCCLGCFSQPNTKYFFSHCTKFRILCPHCPASWAGSQPGRLSLSMCLWF
jgi:hypothetical protein